MATKKKKSTNAIDPLDPANTSIMDNFKKTNEIIDYINKQAKEKQNASSI